MVHIVTRLRNASTFALPEDELRALLIEAADFIERRHSVMEALNRINDPNDPLTLREYMTRHGGLVVAADVLTFTRDIK
jgi:hypothetical protein